MTTRTRLLIRWAGADLERVLEALGATVDDGMVDLASARIRIDRTEPAAGQPRLSVEALPAGSGQEQGTRGALDLAAVGWATIELDRAARDVGGTWQSAADDGLVGAAVWRSPEDHPTTLLLEPNTEGRLAGALARYGEGPIVVYLSVPNLAHAGADLRARPGSGPLGEEWLLPGSNPAGPFMILVAS